MSKKNKAKANRVGRTYNPVPEPPDRIIAVVWEDGSGQEGPVNRSELHCYGKTLYSVGWLLLEDSERIIISQDFTYGDCQPDFREVLHIPQRCVLSRREFTL